MWFKPKEGPDPEQVDKEAKAKQGSLCCEQAGVYVKQLARR